MSTAERIYAALQSHVDVPFNATLSLILLFAYLCALHTRALLLLAVSAASLAIVLYDTTSTRGQMIKVLAELPLGLGSVLLFLLAPTSFRRRHLPAFTAYVNFAVYGNIGMMVLTPAGSTLRGLASKAACLALFAWIVQQGRAIRWKTVRLHERFLVFTAVSRRWILAHAVYRAALLTLPTFGSGRRHRMLELWSLGMTTALAGADGGLKWEQCFGMADTLVVPAEAAWSTISTTFGLLERDTGESGLGAYAIGERGDLVLSAVLVAVAVFAVGNVVQGLRGGRATEDGEVDKRE